ncbi:hypothetical protein OpiT1DRAFT_05817 [Opitutaceae bacterium TAV1]|nr:hypothetical protein OpiT1DRAFT_05817 [Opitutaceae bacterium TAV1]
MFDACAGPPEAGETAPPPLRILYVNTKGAEDRTTAQPLDFASFSDRATVLGALHFNSIILYQFHHFRENPQVRARLVEALAFASGLIRARGEVPRAGTHISPQRFLTDARYREDLGQFFLELKKKGIEPLAATGNTSWVAVGGELKEQPQLLERLEAIAGWCADRGIALYVISDMSTTWDARRRRTQFPDSAEGGKTLDQVLDVADPEPQKLYRQFFANLAGLREKYLAIIGAGLEEFPLQGRLLQDDSPALYGFSASWQRRFATAFPGEPFPAYDSSGGPGNVRRMQFLDAVTADFFAGLDPGAPGFQVTHLHNYVANWRYKMSVPRGNLGGDPYIHDTWMLPSPVTFLQPALLEGDPSIAERFDLLLLHPRGRALNRWHLEQRSPLFGSDRVAASWPFFMAGASAPLVGYLDQLPGVLPRFSGVLVLPYRITSYEEDEALVRWVKKGNILLLGSFAGEGEDGRLDGQRPWLPAKWTGGRDALLHAAGWRLPQEPEEAQVAGEATATWHGAFARDLPGEGGRALSLPLSAGGALALPEAPAGAQTFASLDGKPYVQGVRLGAGWVVWHNFFPFAGSGGRLSARYDSREGWLPLRDLPTRLLRAALAASGRTSHASDESLLLGNGRQTLEVPLARNPAPGVVRYRLRSPEGAAADTGSAKRPTRPTILRSGPVTPVGSLWDREFARYWPAGLPAGHFLTRIDSVRVRTGRETGDGFSVTLSERTLTLEATNERSSLIGLYRLLEKVGWRWVAPGVERFSPDWIVSGPAGLEQRTAAALEIRGMMTHTPLTEESLPWIEWLPRAGYNFFLVPGPWWDRAPQTVKTALAERGLMVEVGAHSFDYWYPHQQYFPIAPETFARVDGSRELPRKRWIGDLLADRQVATTHPDVAPAFARAMDAFARKNPDVARLSLWPNDGFGWDESEEARALDVDGMCKLHPRMPNHARRYFGFVQQVQALRKEPTPATAIAYAATLEFPEGMTIPRDLPVYVAPYLENYAAPLFAEGSGANVSYRNETRKWIAAGARVTLFEYWLKYAWLGQPLPIVGQQQKNIRAFSAAGGAGIMTQAELQGWEVNAPLYYAGGRLLMDPQADAETLIREYFEAASGREAGALLAKFWWALEQQRESLDELTGFSPNLPKLFTPAILALWDRLIADLGRIESPEGRAAAEQWTVRRDVAGRILSMVTTGKALVAQAANDGNGALAGYEKLVQSYDELLSELRTGGHLESFDPLLPRFLASGVLRPVVRRLERAGLPVPAALIREGDAGTL